MPAFASEARLRFTRRYKREVRGGVRFVSVYDFIDWDEDMIVDTIQDELGWRPPEHSETTWRSDCFMHTLKQYVYLRLLGFTKNHIILSGLVREGKVSRDEALEEAQRTNRVSLEDASLALRILEIDPRVLEVAVERGVAS